MGHALVLLCVLNIKVALKAPRGGGDTSSRHAAIMRTRGSLGRAEGGEQSRHPRRSGMLTSHTHCHHPPVARQCRRRPRGPGAPLVRVSVAVRAATCTDTIIHTRQSNFTLGMSVLRRRWCSGGARGGGGSQAAQGGGVPISSWKPPPQDE